MTVSDSPRPDWQADADTLSHMIAENLTGATLIDASLVFARLVARLTQQQSELEAAERIIEAAREVDEHADWCMRYTPWGGCDCGIDELQAALSALPRREEPE